MSRPPMRTVPSTRTPGMTSFIRLSVRRKVLLPQPDGPMNAVTRVRLNPDRNVLQGPRCAVVEVHPLRFDLARADVGHRPLWACRNLAKRRHNGAFRVLLWFFGYLAGCHDGDLEALRRRKKPR